MACLSYIIDRSPSVNMGYYARHVSMQFTLERRLIKMELEGCDYQVNGLRFCSSRIYMYVCIYLGFVCRRELTINCPGVFMFKLVVSI